jgi:hypothetical protein
MSRQRIIAAFILAPLMTPLTFVVTVFFRSSPVASPSGIPVIFLLYAPFAYLAAAIFGIPLFFLFRLLGLKSVAAYLVGGTTIGLVTALVVTKLLVSWSVASGDFVWCGIGGAGSALVFWSIVRCAPTNATPPRVTINGET